MPRNAGMRESGVRMVREKAMEGFFNNLLGCHARGQRRGALFGGTR